MATKLGTLTLDLVAKIGQFVEPMNQAERKARDASEGIADSFNTASLAAKAFGAVVAGASVAGVTAFVNQTINAGNEVQKFSQLANASMAQFQYYAKGAETAGISMESFADKMKDMQDRIGDFQQTGGGPLADFFENIAPLVGVTIEQFQRLSGPEALQLFYDSLEKVGATQNDMKFYMESIISDSSLLIPLLKNGGEGFKKWGDAAQNAGAIMSDSMVEQLVLAKENLKMLDLQWQGFQATLVNNAIPVIQSVADNFDTMKSVAMVLGAYWAGTYIPVIIKGTRAIVADTAGKVTNTLASRAKTVADYEVAKSNLAATAAMVRAMGVTNAQTAAMMTNARAAYQQAAASRAAAVAGTSALGLLGGPVGIGVTLAAVAAGYLLMRDSTDESTKSLRENNESVDDAIKKYKELDEVQRRAQLVSEKNTLQDLAKEYDEVNSKLITATYSFSRHNDMTSEQSKQVNALISEYKKTGDIDQFSGKINALNFISQTSKDRFNTLGGSVKDAGNEFKNQKSFVDQMAPAVKGVGDQAKQTAGEVAGLSAEIQKLLNLNTEGASKSNYLNELVKRNIDPKLAEMMYEARKASNIAGTSERLNAKVLNSVLDRWKADQGLNKTLEERAKIEERNKKLVEAQGNAMKVNALVASNAAKANYAALESAKGLPKGLLSAVNMTESPNSNTARSGAGARGAFQFMPKTAERFNVDVNSVNSSAKGAAEYLDKLLKMFEGNLENALRAYNWGEGNMQNYLKYGSGMKNGQKGYFADKPLPKETREYSGKVMSYMGGASGVSFTENYSFDDWLKEQEQFAIEREKREKEMAEKQKALALEVSTYREKINSELADKLEEIDKAGFDSAKTAELKAEYKKRAEIDIQVSDAAHSEKLAGYSDYLKSEEQLLNESFARRQRDLKLDLSLTSEEYTIASIALENQRKKEVESLRRDERLDVLETKRDWMGKGEYAREYYALVREEILATSTYSPEKKEAMLQYASSQQNREESYERDSAIADYRDVMGYEENPLERQFEVLQKMRELDLLNEEAYQNAKLELQAKSTAGYMEGMLGGFASLVDENSKTYAVLFAAQKAFAVAQAMLNIPAAYSKAYDAVVGTPFVGPYIAPAVGAAAAALQVAQAASMKSVNLTGMAHDGIDNIPREGTWLLDGGERVLNPEQNKDLTRYLSEARESNSSPNVNLNPNFVIVDEREKLGDYLFGSDGKKAFVKFFKQNKRELGFA